MAVIEMKHSPAAAALLRSNLGYFDTEIPCELDEYLDSLLDYAFDEFRNINIFLVPGTLNDDMDQMIFAAWLYRNGVNGIQKHEMLRSIIRNRQVRNALSDREASA